MFPFLRQHLPADFIQASFYEMFRWNGCDLDGAIPLLLIIIRMSIQNTTTCFCLTLASQNPATRLFQWL